jgi:catechol 2,3-dioxygenase-like lactoylglutathione lyase family enzyme
MIDHVSIQVRSLDESAAFYGRVLQPLGMTPMANRPHTVGFGRKYPEFWLNARPGMERVPDDTGHHVCLRAPSVEAVVAFHCAAVEQGGRGEGDPGPRKAEMTDYFGAFIRDPDGNKIEAITFPRDENAEQEGSATAA